VCTHGRPVGTCGAFGGAYGLSEGTHGGLEGIAGAAVGTHGAAERTFEASEGTHGASVCTHGRPECAYGRFEWTHGASGCAFGGVGWAAGAAVYAAEKLATNGSREAVEGRGALARPRLEWRGGGPAGSVVTASFPSGLRWAISRYAREGYVSLKCDIVNQETCGSV